MKVIAIIPGLALDRPDSDTNAFQGYETNTFNPSVSLFCNFASSRSPISCQEGAEAGPFRRSIIFAYSLYWRQEENHQRNT
jgi:hypothetical protein